MNKGSVITIDTNARIREWQPAIPPRRYGCNDTRDSRHARGLARPVCSVQFGAVSAGQHSTASNVLIAVCGTGCCEDCKLPPCHETQGEREKKSGHVPIMVTKPLGTSAPCSTQHHMCASIVARSGPGFITRGDTGRTGKMRPTKRRASIVGRPLRARVRSPASATDN